MARGVKTGGRQKGTLNKRTEIVTRNLINVMERMDYDPYEALISESRREDIELTERIQIHRLLLRYTYPEKSPVEEKSDATNANVTRFYMDIKAPSKDTNEH
jgi:hypothetical protein